MSIKVNVAPLLELAADLSKAPKSLRDLNVASCYRIGQRNIGRLKREYRRSPTTTATATRRRTGKLLDSYDSEVTQPTEGIKLAMGLVKPGTSSQVLSYAAVHEKDGSTVIRPKRGRYLAIPLPAAMTASGVARGGPRDFPNTFLIKGHGGSPIIAQAVGGKRNWSKTQVRPLFVLKRSVTVRGRPALMPVMTNYVLPEVTDAMGKNFEKLFGGAGE